MRLAKRTFLRIFFGMEIIVFVCMYLFGTQGIRVLWHLQDENRKLDGEIAHLSEHVKTLDQQVAAWNTDPFYKEKIARERLHMARKHDVIFYTD